MGRRFKAYGSASDFIDESAAQHFFLSILKPTPGIA